MTARNLWIIALILAVAAVAIVFLRGNANEPQASVNQTTAAPSSSHAENHAPAPQRSTPRVPAFQTASDLDNLAPTLPASQFVGKAGEAYRVAKEIPQTLAQLPCYCECDRGYGHKSLHTCFVDDHASHCAVCVDEALLAYRLQKEEKLTPTQVRERIIEKYSAPQ
ncbi:MAG TPA: CYCXC family (seleno)protein [Pyrinomonadaceae bacterium]|jgi:hypothetical protein